MSITNDILEVETNMENLKKSIRRAELLKTLEQNAAWKELITEGYLRDEPARIVKLTGDIQMRMAGDVQMDWLKDMLTGIGAFDQYMNFIEQAGHAAQAQMEANQETHAELLKEQMDEGIQ